MFPFLIGKVLTNYERGISDDSLLFPFLIGKVLTLMMKNMQEIYF